MPHVGALAYGDQARTEPIAVPLRDLEAAAAAAAAGGSGAKAKVKRLPY